MQAKAQEKHDSAPHSRPCPICGKPASAADRPFCSARCADVDLHRWLKGAYALPATPDDDDTDDSGLKEAPPEQD
jgi:endogenous inhibitor of DNA gyrase (YacG/DUF329 family)